MATTNLDSFVISSRPPPKPTATSQEIRDRGSTFVANIFQAPSLDDARRAIDYLRNVTHSKRRATHEISAWRCMSLKGGKSGLGGPDDFEVASGSDDDGEKYAGGRILKVMQAEGALDAVVIVSRWYGGEMLGPVRFEHIETCTREVCRSFVLKEQVEDAITTLTTLDSILLTLREELAQLKAVDSAPPPGDLKPKKPQDYSSLRDTLDTKKANRLVTARENSVKSVKLSLAKLKEQLKMPVDEAVAGENTAGPV
ncbi:hypothetical protein QCA50_020278 [Cerrena zonata]|uniref:Impact N-terminal domain-containing protein n=1 Tax=Cerrena zonata TaxID=2478898 RepID=A0AAW0F7Z0_9APHY